MINILKNLIKSHKNNFFSYFKNRLAMASESVKNKSDFKIEHLPVKKIKLADDNVEKRTVATMCGGWRPEEDDGGLIFVFKTREPWASPDPTKESDYPENIEDFWEASLMATDDIQVGEGMAKWGFSGSSMLCDCGAIQNSSIVFPLCPAELNVATDNAMAVTTFWAKILAVETKNKFLVAK